MTADSTGRDEGTKTYTCTCGHTYAETFALSTIFKGFVNELHDKWLNSSPDYEYGTGEGFTLVHKYIGFSTTDGINFTINYQEEYPVKQIKDITPAMCESFITRRLSEGCTVKTARAYKSNLLKLQHCSARAFHINPDYSVTVDESKAESAVSIKEYAFTREEMEKILDAPRKSQSLYALQFAYFTGCRVNTLERLEVRHIDFKRCEITIFKDKGGRTRTIAMNEQTAKFLRERIRGKNPQDRVFDVKKGSVNRYLRRRCQKLGICTTDGRIKSGVHSIRKLHAEEYAVKHGTGATMKMLGHGEQRSDLEQTYLHSKK